MNGPVKLVCCAIIFFSISLLLELDSVRSTLSIVQSKEMIGAL